MRFGIAIDLHATAAAADEVSFTKVLQQVRTAEDAGLDLVALPDHLQYRAGGDGDYATSDAAVGVRESTTVAAALAAATDTIGIAHSVINAPYRHPAMLAHVAASLTDIAAGRYSLGIGVGNSFEYDQLDVAADHRVARFEETLVVLAALLRDGAADVDGTYIAADRAELTLRPEHDHRPPLIVAAGGPRTMRSAVRYGDGWNGFVATDPDDRAVVDLLELLRSSCDDQGRDPADVVRTADLGVDPLDRVGARDRSIATLARLRDLGFDEVRCYAVAEPTHVGRMAAIEAFGELTRSV